MCLAVPGRVIEITGADELRSARVDFGGVTREASLIFVPETELGDYVLVHVGFAISRIDEEAARAAHEAFEELVRIEREREAPVRGRSQDREPADAHASVVPRDQRMSDGRGRGGAGGGAVVAAGRGGRGGDDASSR